MKWYHLFLRRKRYKAIVNPTSVYSLFLYEMMELHKKEETLFIFKEIFAPFGKGACPDFWEIKEITSNRYSGILLWHAIPVVVWCLSKYYKNVPVYVNGGERHARLFQHFFDKVVFLEDGVGNYLLRDPGALAALPKQTRRQRFIFPSLPPLGMDKKVKTIYLTGFLPIPEAVAHKVKEVSLQAMWQKKTKEQQQAMCDAYLPPDWQRIVASGRSVVLLTQPWSEDCYTYPKQFTEADKIELYKTILRDYDEKQVILKTHPRERTDYRTYFPDVLVIDTPTPMELFILVGLQVSKAITTNSSSIHSFGKDVETIMLGTCVTEKLERETRRRREAYNKEVKWQDDTLVALYDRGTNR